MPEAMYKVKTEAIVSALSKNSKYLNCRELTNLYMESPSSSDILTTLNICNILSVVGLVRRKVILEGRKKRVMFKGVKNV